MDNVCQGIRGIRLLGRHIGECQRVEDAELDWSENRASLQQPRLPQPIREGREVLRPADREPIREIGDA